MHELLTVTLAYITGTVLHEAAHAYAAASMGLHVKGVVCDRRGIGVVRQYGLPVQNALVALAGPMAHVALAVLFWGGTFGIYQLVLAAANLLPLPQADGGRALDALRRMLAA